MTQAWQFWALLSAVFAALTAIFAKIGVADITPTSRRLIRTAIILVVVVSIVCSDRQWQRPTEISGRTWLFLGLSGLATGASWLAYFRALKLAMPLAWHRSTSCRSYSSRCSACFFSARSSI